MTKKARPSTPPVLYFLALLVVGAIWWFWQDTRTAPGERHLRWETQTLSNQEIAEGLSSSDAERIGHALVQLKRLLLSEPLPATDWLAARATNLLALKEHANPTIRQYVAYPLAYWPGDAKQQVQILTELLTDDNALVSLNAAIALAARKNPAGADRLQRAILDTKGEQQAMRTSLLADFRFVAQKRHRSFLEDELNRARLDHDSDRESFCQQALERIPKDK